MKLSIATCEFASMNWLYAGCKVGLYCTIAKLCLIVQIVLDRFAGLAGDVVVAVLRYAARACGCHVAELGGTSLS